MGWTSYNATHYKNGRIDRKAECDAYFLEGLNRGFYEVLKSCMVGSTYYAAIKPLKKRGVAKEQYIVIPAEEQYVFAVVFLTSINMEDYDNFSYKDMDESCGPYRYECPKGILDLLTPTDNEYANQWREACRKYHEEKKNRNILSKLPIGSEIKYKRPNGEEVVAYKHPPCYQFKRPFWYLKGMGMYVRAQNIPSDYEIIRRGE